MIFFQQTITPYANLPHPSPKQPTWNKHFHGQTSRNLRAPNVSHQWYLEGRLLGRFSTGTALELNNIEPLIASTENTTEKMGLHQKFVPESEDILRTRFQHANETIELIRLAFDKQINIETIHYDHPLEDKMSEIIERIKPNCWLIKPEGLLT